MSKRAEQKALEIYPVLFSERNGYPSPMPDRRNAFVKGYEQAEKDLGWHSVDESLPPIDEEVIVLLADYGDIQVNPIYKIAFGHIVDKNITVDYNSWNIPGVKYWMHRPELPEEK